MAAYAALVSIMQIIHQIENHPFPPISMDKQQVESLTEIVTLLQEFLEGYKSPVAADGDEADPLEMRIADAVYAAEDAIESHIVDQILPAASADKRDRIGFFNCFRGLKKPKNYGTKINSADLYESLQKVIEEMDLIKKEVMEIVSEKAPVKDQLQRQVSASAGSSTSSKMLRNNSSTSSLSRLNSTMMGFDDVMLQLMDKLTDGRLGRQVIPIVGMGGIGKTTLARNIYAQPLISHHFDICAWVTISQQYNTKELLCEILSQANKEERERLSRMSEDGVGLALYQHFTCRRFLIVLDDMWSIEAWEKIQRYFPDNSNSSRIMVTTRLSNLGSQFDNNDGLEMKFLDEESSWNMFSEIVFGGKSCPLEVEKIGKEIVKSCRGLPLSIVVMGGLLEKLERTKECWESIRRSLNSLVNSENDKHCLKILKLSYNHLPAYLRPCFLYLGTFEEDSEIQVSTVIKLWVSEGLIKLIKNKSLETIGKEYLEELVDRNLLLVHKLGRTGSMKYCKIHDLLRDLCLREAQKEGFYHVVGIHSPQGACSQRRVVIPRSTSKKKVLDAMKSAPNARSYISDPSERVRLLPNLRLLRTLKAYEKGSYVGYTNSLGKMFELVNLRLLVVEAHQCFQLPSSINLLWSLQTLIVSHFETDVNAPIEIWKMPQLRHVHFYRRALHLPYPPSDSIVIMENLQTLKEIRNFKCDEETVRRIPNIKKLKLIYYEDDGTESRDDEYCVHNIERLQMLESLSFICSERGDVLQKLTFPHSLKSLTLKMSWGGMEDILEKVSTLPHLQKLNLKFGVFTTGKWETVEGQFLSLKYLSLQFCSDLECWTMDSSHFPCLEHLRLRSIDLKEIPTDIGEIPTLKSVTLDYCSEKAVKSAKRMVEEQEELQGEDLPFKVAVTVSRKNQELQRWANPNFQVTDSGY